MGVIPVLDIQKGIVVHGQKGQREHYKPLRSLLVESCEPVKVLESFSAKLGCNEFYIADLDAIAGTGENFWFIREWDRARKLVMVDAGANNLTAVNRLFAAGVDRAVIGSETLENLEHLVEILAVHKHEKIIFSVDLYGGTVISRSAALAGIHPVQAITKLRGLGLNQFILLELSKVGTSTGIDFPLVRAVVLAAGKARVIVGGGIREINEVLQLQGAGVDGVLIATAFHTGAITPDDVKKVQSLQV